MISKEKYPELSRLFKKTMLREHLRELIEYTNSKDKPRMVDLSENEWYTASIGWLITQHGGSAEAWQSHFIFFILAGLIVRIKPDRHTRTSVMKREYQKAKESKKAPSSFFYIPEYTPDILEKAEVTATILKAHHVSVSRITKADVERMYGRSKANSIYRDGRHISKAETWARERLKKKMLEEISKHGYTTKNAVYKASRTRKISEEKQKAMLKSKQRITQIIQEAGCLYKPPTKEQRERYNLKDGKWIIVKSNNV